MLKKLLKYDLENIFKFLLIFYSLAMFFAVLTRIFFGFENSLVMEIIGQICSGAMISMICSTLINNLMRMWVRFKQNFYGDESYLTHTLPVEKTTLYSSKILTAVISSFVSLIVIAGALFTAYYSKENLQLLKSLLLPMADAYDTSIMGILLTALVVIFLEFLNILQSGFAGIILGHRMNNAKTGFSVLYGFITYTVSQCFVLVIMFIVALFNKNIMNLFATKDIVSVEALKAALFIAIIAYTLIVVVMYFVNTKLFNKGVDVD